MQAPGGAQPDTGHPRRWTILAVLVVSLVVVVLDNTVLNVAMKTIADPTEGLGATQGELQWSINSYTLVFAGLLFTFGVLGDRLGRRRMLLVGLVLFGLTSLASAYSTSPDQLIWARAGMGIGAAAILPATLSIISNVFSPAERGRAIGMWAGAVGLGAAIGPIVGGLLLETFWWGSVFLINVPVVAAGVVAVLLLVPESRDPRPGRIDIVGVLASIAGLVALTYGIITGGDTGEWASFEVWGSILGGVLILTGFVLYERRIDHPVLDIKLFRERRFSAAVATVGLVFFAAMGLMFFFTFYLQLVRDYSPLETGLLFLPFAVAQLIFAPRSAAFVKRYGARAVSTVGMSLVTLVFLAYLLIDADSPVWLVGLLFFVQGAGMANVMPPATEAVMSSLPREKAGVGSAVSNTIRQVGGALGVAVLGSLLSQIYRDDLTPKLANTPAGVRDAATDSVAATYGIADKLGADGLALLAPANESFLYAMHWTCVAAAVVGVVGVIVSFTWLPAHTPRGDAAGEPELRGAPQPALVEAS